MYPSLACFCQGVNVVIVRELSLFLHYQLTWCTCWIRYPPTNSAAINKKGRCGAIYVFYSYLCATENVYSCIQMTFDDAHRMLDLSVNEWKIIVCTSDLTVASSTMYKLHDTSSNNPVCCDSCNLCVCVCVCVCVKVRCSLRPPCRLDQL